MVGEGEFNVKQWDLCASVHVFVCFDIKGGWQAGHGMRMGDFQLYNSGFSLSSQQVRVDG